MGALNFFFLSNNLKADKAKRNRWNAIVAYFHGKATTYYILLLVSKRIWSSKRIFCIESCVDEYVLYFLVCISVYAMNVQTTAFQVNENMRNYFVVGLVVVVVDRVVQIGYNFLLLFLVFLPCKEDST